MAIALFTSEQAIKDTTYLDENVDMKLLRDTIELCQDKYILPLVGTAIYNELNTQVTTNTVSAQNTTLLDTYIQKVLRWWVLYEGVDVLTYKFMNKSVVKKNSENSSPIDTEEIRRLMEKFRTNAEMYSQRMTDFFLANLSTYTLYLQPGTSYDTIIPKKNSYTTSIWLGSDNGSECCNLTLEQRFQGNIDECCK